jgi:Na+/melibiose symporter-like transporter
MTSLRAPRETIRRWSANTSRVSFPCSATPSVAWSLGDVADHGFSLVGVFVLCLGCFSVSFFRTVRRKQPPEVKVKSSPSYPLRWCAQRQRRARVVVCLADLLSSVGFHVRWCGFTSASLIYGFIICDGCCSDALTS